MKKQGYPLSISPMASARFLSGKLYLNSAEKLAKAKDRKQAKQAYAKALTEFGNVFRKYGDSDWGPEAGIKSSEVKEILIEQYGAKIKVDVRKAGGTGKKAGAKVFKAADVLFFQKKYDQAITEYTWPIKLYPDSEVLAKVLGNLAMSYANVGDPLYAKVVIEHLKERYTAIKKPLWDC
ncbi:MAG: hypothetical protein GKR87_10150 [Kiritimatiellae bacterium]|nr:hypothetical protein [Kiritimatiellia bacterium]